MRIWIQNDKRRNIERIGFFQKNKSSVLFVYKRIIANSTISKTNRQSKNVDWSFEQRRWQIKRKDGFVLDNVCDLIDCLRGWILENCWIFNWFNKIIMLKIILALVLAILLIVCIVKFEIALFKFLTVVFLIALVCVLVYM